MAWGSARELISLPPRVAYRQTRLNISAITSPRRYTAMATCCPSWPMYSARSEVGNGTTVIVRSRRALNTSSQWSVRVIRLKR